MLPSWIRRARLPSTPQTAAPARIEGIAGHGRPGGHAAQGHAGQADAGAVDLGEGGQGPRRQQGFLGDDAGVRAAVRLQQLRLLLPCFLGGAADHGPLEGDRDRRVSAAGQLAAPSPQLPALRVDLELPRQDVGRRAAGAVHAHDPGDRPAGRVERHEGGTCQRLAEGVHVGETQLPVDPVLGDGFRGGIDRLRYVVHPQNLQEPGSHLAGRGVPRKGGADAAGKGVGHRSRPRKVRSISRPQSETWRSGVRVSESRRTSISFSPCRSGGAVTAYEALDPSTCCSTGSAG